LIIISITSRGVYSYFTFGEKVYGQNSTEGSSENITKFPIYYVDGLITGNIKINLTKFIYDDESIKIQLLSRDEKHIGKPLPVEKGNAAGEYICKFNNDEYKAIKYKIIGYGYKDAEYLTSNEMNKENVFFKRTLTINYYDKTTDNLSASVDLSYRGKSESKNSEFPPTHDKGKWRKVTLSYDNIFCANGTESSYDINIGTDTYKLTTDIQNKEIWIKRGKVYDYEPPEEHKITFIIDSDLNTYSEESKFDLSNFPGIAVTTGIATKIDGKYTFSTTYEETNYTKFGFDFKVDGNRFVHNIRNIIIPTWDEGESTVDYSYSSQYFNNLSAGGIKGNPSLTVSQDKEGNVTVTARMVEKNSQ
ncbi:MAG: hypothetical protein SOV35_09425, partial [Clostridium sp.]|nr:hypothetical protein [Clostridium sp.]